MLVNSVTAITRAAPRLKRIVLVTGTKYYGVHLGPLKTPMRETDPSNATPNYYSDQIDWLTAFQRGKEWDRVELRPQTLCGFSPGSAMSILPAIAVYAAISKELGLPLRFPGKPGAYDSIYQVTESRILPMRRCGLRRISETEIKPSTLRTATISDGETFGQRIAAVFEMSLADPQTICLTQHMADKGPRWEKMTAKYKLSVPLHGSRRLAIRGLCLWCGPGRYVGRHQIATLWFPRCGRRRGDVRTPAQPVS